MSGIVGVWNLDGRPLSRDLLTDLVATLAHRGPDGDGAWVAGSVGLACELLRVTPEAARESQPCFSASGHTLVFDGRLDNRDELLVSLDRAAGIERDSPDPDLVLAAYEKFGEGLPERLNGDFAFGLYDPRRQRLLLARDALGVRPLYYCHRPRVFIFASEIKALLAHPEVPVRPDDEFLARFLIDDISGFEGRTCFDGVVSLPPAHVALLTVGALTRRRYWDFDPAQRLRVGSFEDAAAEFRQHFATAVRRRLRSGSPVAVSLSGGLDSSAIFCLAQRFAACPCPPVIGFSYIPPTGSPADETSFLAEIERHYSLAIERLPVQRLGLLNGSRDAVRHVETPFLDEQWNTTVTLLEAVRHRGCRVLLTGHWGDQILFDQAYLVDLVRRLSWWQALAHLREYGRWFSDSHPRWFRRRFALDLVKYSLPISLLPFLRRCRRHPRLGWYGTRLTAHLRRRRPAAWPSPVAAAAHARALYEQARSAYHVVCMEWNNKVAAAHGLEMAFPFLDRDLVAFLMGLPGEVQTWRGVPKALHREAMRGILPDPIVGRRWKADFTSLVNEGVEQDFRHVVGTVLDGVAIGRGYLRGEVIRKDLERVRQGLQGSSAAHAWRVSDLLGLELWLQVFGEGERSAAPGAVSTGGKRR